MTDTTGWITYYRVTHPLGATMLVQKRDGMTRTVTEPTRVGTTIAAPDSSRLMMTTRQTRRMVEA